MPVLIDLADKRIGANVIVLVFGTVVNIATSRIKVTQIAQLQSDYECTSVARIENSMSVVGLAAVTVVIIKKTPVSLFAS